jgi:hypothetical protein
MQPSRKDNADPAADNDASTTCTVSAPASALYLYLWNRADAAQADVTIIGNADLLTCWQSSVRVRWS